MSYLYEKYHSRRYLQKRVISDNNFTYKYILKYIKYYIKEGDNILDIGSGTGTLDFYIVKKYKNTKVLGIDISQNAIDIATRNSKNLKLSKNVKFQLSKFPNEKIKNKFNVIICSEILEHLQDDKSAVKKINRLLLPKGIVIASSPSLNAPLYKMGLLNNFDKEVGHLRRYKQNTFEKLFKVNSFCILSTERTEGVLRNFLFTNNVAGKTIRFIRGPLVYIITFLDKILIKIFGESQLFVIAQKQ
jgi:2-polyprenyl-3-methyl-5-hydroxy-6-metoxy-1,4-benzoquinol methylase